MALLRCITWLVNACIEFTLWFIRKWPSKRTGTIIERIHRFDILNIIKSRRALMFSLIHAWISGWTKRVVVAVINTPWRTCDATVIGENKQNQLDQCSTHIWWRWGKIYEWNTISFNAWLRACKRRGLFPKPVYKIALRNWLVPKK